MTAVVPKRPRVRPASTKKAAKAAGSHATSPKALRAVTAGSVDTFGRLPRGAAGAASARPSHVDVDVGNAPSKHTVAVATHPEWFWHGEKKWKAPPKDALHHTINSDNTSGAGWIEKWVAPATGKWVHNYTEAEMVRRAGEKFVDNRAFAKHLPQIRAQIDVDMAGPDAKRKVIALVVALIDHTYIRVGNEDSTHRSHEAPQHASRTRAADKKQDTYGITTMHVGHWQGGKGLFAFLGKSEVAHLRPVRDAKLKRKVDILARHRPKSAPLFHVNGAHITAVDVNAYLAPWGATAKKFRTYHATRMAFEQLTRLHAAQPRSDAGARETSLPAVISAVALQIGHDAATCKKHYIDPAVLELFVRGKLPRAWP